MGLRSTYLHNFQLQQKQYCGDWMLLSLRYEDHLYAKLFHHLVSLHCYDQVICHVWWKNGFEIRIILITIRGFGISKITNPKSVAMEMVGGRVYLFWFGGKSEEMKQKRERAKATQNQVHNFCYPPTTCPKEQHIMSFVELV